MQRLNVAVEGMSCTGCEQNVENALETVAGVNRSEADHESGTVDVVIGDDVADEDVYEAIEQAGYDVEA